MQGDSRGVEPVPEPPVGFVARDGKVHEWRRESDGWWGCFVCDSGELVVPWGWLEILEDAYDTALTIAPAA